MSIVAAQASKTYPNFSPTGIPNCLVWLDARDPNGNGSIPANGSTVSTWVDKSRNGYNASLRGTATYSSTGFNTSYPAIVFNTAQYYGTFPSTTTTTITAFLVVNMSTSTPNNTRMISLGAASTTDVSGTSAVALLIRDSDGRIKTLQGAAGANFATTWSLTLGTNWLVNANFTGTAVTGYNNGTLNINSGNTNSLTLSAYALGNNIVNSVGLGIGSFCEFILYNGTLTTTQRQQMEGYLAQKWGLVSNISSTHPFRYTPLFPRLFQPIDISNCSLWLDAADISTVTLSGSSVTQWNDKSGNGRNTTTIGGSPVYSNGSILLNGSSTYLRGPYVNTTTTITAFVVGTVDFSSGVYSYYYRLLSVGSATANDFDNIAYAALILHNPNTTSIGGYRNGATNYVSVTTNTRFLISQQYNGTNATIYLNGNFGSQVASSGSFNTSVYSIGRDAGNTSTDYNPAPIYSYTYWPGSISEVILYNANLTTLQRQQVESYLAQKWGLVSNLPSTHQFKLIPSLTVPFNPLQIANCALWLDGADISTITLSGSNITQWNDKSGNGKNATVATGTIAYSNGSLIFTGSQAMDILSLSSIMSTQNIFIVSSTNTSAYVDILGVRSASSFTGVQVIMYNYAPILSRYAGGMTLTSSTTVTQNSNFLLNAVYVSGGTSLIYLNGTQTASLGSSPSLANTGTVMIGGYYSSSYGELYNGKINEIIIYTSTLTTSQRQQVEGYLAWKWGLVNSLPSTNIYKKFVP